MIYQIKDLVNLIHQGEMVMSTEIRKIPLQGAGSVGGNLPLSRLRAVSGVSVLEVLRMGTSGLRTVMSWVYEFVKLLARRALHVLQVPSARDLYPALLFMAEASVAAQGYPILPSIAGSREGKHRGDWLRSWDL